MSETLLGRLGDGGRDGMGRFTAGNKGGPGNPLGARVARFRQVLLEAISEDDLRQVARELVGRARQGERWAVQELLLRTIGRPLEADVLRRLDEIEAAIGQGDRR